MSYNNSQLNYALSLHQAGGIAEAAKLYEEILAKEPNNVEILHLLGILAAQQEDFKHAYELISRAISINPQSPTLHNSMGNILRHLNQLENALKHYNFAIRLEPNNAVTYNNMAIIYQKLNHIAVAITHYREAIKLNPKYTDAHYNLGAILLLQNDIENAFKQFNTTVLLQPKHAAAHCNLALIYQQKNEIEQALNHYIKALRTDPNNITAHHNLGTILVTKNKVNSAIRHFQKTLQLDPLHQEAFYNLGAAFMLQNKPESALKYFLRLSQLVKEFDVYYNLGIIYADINRLNDAINYFNEALKIKPGDFSTHNNLGAIYLRQENINEALLHYKKALESQPNNQEIAYITSALSQSADIPYITAPIEYTKHLFDQYAKNYDKHLEFLHYQAPQQLHDAILEILNPEHSSLDILDLGCGTGLCGEKFRYLANKLTGVDLSEKMLVMAKNKNIYDELKCGTIEDLLSQYTNQDLIVAADTFVYIGDLSHIFDLCNKSLKNKAFFAFTIEQTDKYPYILQQNGRFAHHQKYITELAKKNDFVVSLYKEAKIRKHREKFIECLLYVLEKKQ